MELDCGVSLDWDYWDCLCMCLGFVEAESQRTHKSQAVTRYESRRSMVILYVVFVYLFMFGYGFGLSLFENGITTMKR